VQENLNAGQCVGKNVIIQPVLLATTGKNNHQNKKNAKRSNAW
jgi:hypothetical protein